MKPDNLNEILHYKNHNVVKRYIKDYQKPPKIALQYFKEMLKFLWLAQQVKIDKKHKDVLVAMYPDMRDIDNMWHTFILFTRDYEKFCKNYFNHFIHHTPNTATEKIDKKKNLEQLETFLIYVEKKLGEDTLKTWFKPTLETK